MRSAFVENTCVPFLLGAQNADGGWGFQAGSASRPEPTAWALLALRESALANGSEAAAGRATGFLIGSQLVDGSWPTASGQEEGSWATSLAGLALLGAKNASQNVSRALEWLCKEVPGEARTWHRFMKSLRPKQKLAVQDDSLFGWSWTAGTASWVEPTSYAILLLRAAPAQSLPGAAERRRQTAEAMLYDRMCPGGGWNCGNPMVYGVPGDPQVTSTVWALVALREHTERAEVQQSLQWLEKKSPEMQSPGSMALAVLALNLYGRPEAGPLAESLGVLHGKKDFEWNVAEMAWTALALSGTRGWLQAKSEGRK